MWLRVDAGDARGEERMGSSAYWGRQGTSLGDSGSTGASCGYYGQFLFEGRQGRMLDAAGSGSKEEAKSTLGRVIMRVIEWGYRSVIDKDMISTGVADYAS